MLRIQTSEGKGYHMSLAVPAGLLKQAQRGEVDDEAFLDCVRTSLPYGWSVITGLIAALAAGGADFTSARSQLLNQRPELVDC